MLTKKILAGAGCALAALCWSMPAHAVVATIHQIQGSAHKSPLDTMAVEDVVGIVTAVVTNGFYMQTPDASNDAADATSQGIFVFTAAAPGVAVGDLLSVDGTVSEFYAGGPGSGNLSITEITSPTVSVTSSGNPLPAPVVIGTGGRVPPAQTIEDDVAGTVETSGVFDPASDGIDFYESLEGMRVQVDDARVVGPTTTFGELAVIGESGAGAGLLSPRGALVVRADDFNPERILLDDAFVAPPDLVVGDVFTAAVVGVVGYSFGNFKLEVTSALAAAAGGLALETTAPQPPERLTVATLNLSNLEPASPAAKFTALATQIVTHLRSPAILAVQEIQDNNGSVNNGVVDASATYAALITAIALAGGPTYDYRQIDPVNNSDGGAPGGNIRVALLFDPTRVTFIDRPGGDAVTATTAVSAGSGVELTLSPGRVEPTDPAFANSRKSLAGEFSFLGAQVFVVVNHFISKGGDNPLFGRFQPPVLASEAQRIDQADAIAGFVSSILALDAQARVVVLGDFNDFQFSPPLAALEAAGLSNLHDLLPEEERYTFLFDGNAEALDHILVSPALLGGGPEFDIVHVNAEFLPADQSTDHDPVVAALQVSEVSVVEIPALSAVGLGALSCLLAALALARIRRRTR